MMENVHISLIQVNTRAIIKHFQLFYLSPVCLSPGICFMGLDSFLRDGKD